jgi:Ferritin-like domain
MSHSLRRAKIRPVDFARKRRGRGELNLYARENSRRTTSPAHVLRTQYDILIEFPCPCIFLSHTSHSHNHTRRHWFRFNSLPTFNMKVSSCLAGASLAGIAFSSPIEKRQSTNIDNTILQFALTLEHLENVFYKGAVSNFTAQDFADAGYGATVCPPCPLLSGILADLSLVLQQPQIHRL